jgi:MFS family permease
MAGILGATRYKELLPVGVALFISLGALVLIKWFLPESRACSLVKPVEKKELSQVFGQELRECVPEQDRQLYRLKNILSLEHIPFLLFLTFFIFLGFNLFYTAFPVHAAQTLQWSIPELGLFFVVLSGLMAVVQGPVLGRISEKTADSTLIILGGLVLGSNFLLLLSLNDVVVYAAAVLFAVGNGLLWPSFLSFLSKTAGSRYQGAVQGIASSFGSVASIIGLIAGGLLYAAFKARTFLISAVIIFMVVGFSVVLKKIEKTSS